MTDAVALAAIDAFEKALTAMGVLGAAWFSYKASVHSRANLEVSKETQKQTDGMGKELLKLTAKSSNLEGRIAGAEQERNNPGSPPSSEPATLGQEHST